MTKVSSPAANFNRYQVAKCKATLAGRLLELETLAEEKSAPTVVVALAELATDLSFTVFGRELTLEMLQDLADLVSSRR
jgi:hypothetical protein